MLSIALTLGLQRQVLIAGCCPVANVLVWRVVPVLVATPAPLPDMAPDVPARPVFTGATPHVARI